MRRRWHVERSGERAGEFSERAPGAAGAAARRDGERNGEGIVFAVGHTKSSKATGGSRGKGDCAGIGDTARGAGEEALFSQPVGGGTGWNDCVFGGSGVEGAGGNSGVLVARRAGSVALQVSAIPGAYRRPADGSDASGGGADEELRGAV